MKAAFFDADMTIVNDFSGISFLELATLRGLFKKESLEELLNANVAYRAKEITYEQLSDVWGKTISEGLHGQKQDDVYELTDEFWTIIGPKFASWAKDLVSLFNEHGFETILISGSNKEIVDLYKDKLGFSKVFGTEVEVKDGIYTAKLLQNTVLDVAKEKIFLKVVEEDNIDTENSFGFGDTEHDKAFLTKVGHPIPINPTPGLKQYAEEHRWQTFTFSDNVFEAIKLKLS